MNIENSSFGEYRGTTVGMAQESRWQYPVIGYNATAGIFYVGEDEAKELAFTPFALRQCKEVTDTSGRVHRYPIRQRKTEMVEGDMTTRVQVVGLVGDELYVFGARSWTARAAWLNPRSGQWHDPRFEVGIWYRLDDYIKQVKVEKGIATAPLCYRLKLVAGDAIELSSAANSKQRAKGCPIKALSLAFVGAEAAQRNEQLYIDEALDEWIAEWNAPAVSDAAAGTDTHTSAPLHPATETADEMIPF